jgi:Glu-tRNA(Gln) amidotransferase subunit E-like FAD-binding protein
LKNTPIDEILDYGFTEQEIQEVQKSLKISHKKGTGILFPLSHKNQAKSIYFFEKMC